MIFRYRKFNYFRTLLFRYFLPIHNNIIKLKPRTWNSKQYPINHRLNLLIPGILSKLFLNLSQNFKKLIFVGSQRNDTHVVRNEINAFGNLLFYNQVYFFVSCV